MPAIYKLSVARHDADGHKGAVTIEIDKEWPIGVGVDFESAKADAIEELTALLEKAKKIEEPDPTPYTVEGV